MISCKEYASIMKEELKNTICELERSPKLVVIQVGSDSASNSYIKGKKKDCSEVGIECEHLHYKDDMTERDLLNIINYLNFDDAVDGIIVQLPLPEQFCVKNIQQAICKCKDVDGFRLDSDFSPCTPKGIMDWIQYNNIELRGQNVTVLGRSEIVGKPLVNMMINAGATVTCCNSKTKHREYFTETADIVISAIGKPKLLKNGDFKAAKLIVDVGINRDDDGKLCGDVDMKDVQTEYGNNMYVTPVPGGVGLLTRYALLANTLKAYCLKQR